MAIHGSASELNRIKIKTLRVKIATHGIAKKVDRMMSMIA